MLCFQVREDSLQIPAISYSSQETRANFSSINKGLGVLSSELSRKYKEVQDLLRVKRELEKKELGKIEQQNRLEKGLKLPRKNKFGEKVYPLQYGIGISSYKYIDNNHNKIWFYLNIGKEIFLVKCTKKIPAGTIVEINSKAEETFWKDTVSYFSKKKVEIFRFSNLQWDFVKKPIYTSNISAIESIQEFFKRYIRRFSF